MPDTSKTPAKSKHAASKPEAVFSDEELAAMKEMKAERRKGKANGEADVLAKIAEMDSADSTLAKAIHAIVKAQAPSLSPKTWYGMPAYANADGKIVCFFQAAGKFKARYATLGFNDAAQLDEGNMWPSSFALIKLTANEEKRIGELISRAAGA
jgi:uncharacterized protein YdhG (YjbR/CyaY superfamily)